MNPEFTHFLEQEATPHRSVICRAGEMRRCAEITSPFPQRSFFIDPFQSQILKGGLSLKEHPYLDKQSIFWDTSTCCLAENYIGYCSVSFDLRSRRQISSHAVVSAAVRSFSAPFLDKALWFLLTPCLLFAICRLKMLLLGLLNESIRSIFLCGASTVASCREFLPPPFSRVCRTVA